MICRPSRHTVSSTSLDQKLRRLARSHFEDRSRRRGLLVAFEGPDGSGKTTQRKLFKTWLKAERLRRRHDQVELVRSDQADHQEPQGHSGPQPAGVLAAPRRRLQTPGRARRPAGAVGGQAGHRRPVPVHRPGPRRGARARLRSGAQALSTAALARPRLLLLRVARHVATNASPPRAHRTFYEAGQDVTDIDEPTASYERFIARVIREYESLALIFRFITVDAEQSIHDQHQEIRRLFREGEQRPWSDWNLDAVVEWLAMRGAARVTANGSRLISIDGVNAHALKDTARSVAAANRKHRAGISSVGRVGHLRRTDGRR